MVRFHKLVLIAALLSCPFILSMYQNNVHASSNVNSNLLSRNVANKNVDLLNDKSSLKNTNRSNNNNLRLGGLHITIDFRKHSNRGNLSKRWNSRTSSNGKYAVNDLYYHVPKLYGANLKKLSTTVDYNAQKLYYQRHALKRVPNSGVISKNILTMINSSSPRLHKEKAFNLSKSAFGSYTVLEAINSFRSSAGLSTSASDTSSAVKSINKKPIRKISSNLADVWATPWGSISRIHTSGFKGKYIKLPSSKNFQQWFIDGKLLKSASINFAAALVGSAITHDPRMFNVTSSVSKYIRPSKLYFASSYNRSYRNALENILHIGGHKAFPSYRRWLKYMTINTRKIRKRLSHRRARNIRHIRAYIRHNRGHIKSSNKYDLSNNITSKLINHKYGTNSVLFNLGKQDADYDIDSGRDSDSVSRILHHGLLGNESYDNGFIQYIDENGNDGNGSVVISALRHIEQDPEAANGFTMCLENAGASAPGIVQDQNSDPNFHRGWYLGTIYIYDGNMSDVNSNEFNRGI